MKTAFAYHRYSYVDQKDGYTLEIQRKTTKKLADKYECTILNIYEDEGISGATIDKRPSMLAMLADIQKEKPNYIICVDQDRLSRGNEFWYCKSLMLKSGTSIITEKEGIINFGEDIAKDFLSDVIASAAKYERGMIKQRVKRAMLERTSKGLQVGTLTGIFGYDYHEGNIVINDKEAEIVRLIFKMYIEGKGYHSIKNYLNENGYRTKFGNTFKSCNIKRILEKPTYCGYITHLDKVIKGVHQPIISEDIFNQAQNRYSQNKKRNPKMKVKHLLTGFLHCGSCNSRMQIGYHGGKAFYECSAYYTGNCKKPVYIGKDILENYVIGKVVKIISKMDLKFDSEKKVKQESNLFEVKINQQKIKQKIDRLLEQYVEGNIDEVNYRRLNDKLRKELNQAKTIKENPKIDLSFLKDFKIEKVWHELEFIDKRKILEVLIDRVVVERYNRKDKLTDRVKITFNKFQS